MSGWVEASVSLLKCGSCLSVTPQLTFGGDTDMVTSGLISLSSIAADEIVVADATRAELHDLTGKLIEGKIAKSFNRQDLRYLRLLRAEETTAPQVADFQTFLKRYRPRQLVFACPKCMTGEARSIQSITPTAYKDAGGKITILTDIELRD